MFVCVCAHDCRYPWRPEEGARSLGVGVLSVWAAQCGHWELKRAVHAFNCRAFSPVLHGFALCWWIGVDSIVWQLLVPLKSVVMSPVLLVIAGRCLPLSFFSLDKESPIYPSFWKTNFWFYWFPSLFPYFLFYLCSLVLLSDNLGFPPLSPGAIMH